MSGFVVRVADNFHYMDESEAYDHGCYPTWEEALLVARRIVDPCLADYQKPGMTADELFHMYASFGDDPYISPGPDGQRFSAWDYARERAGVLCA